MKKLCLASIVALTASTALGYGTVPPNGGAYTPGPGAPTGQPGAFQTDAQGGVNSRQYHSYDGLVCTDCHTLHNSENGTPAVVAGYASGESPNRELLYRADWTDMCLSCHKEGQNTSATAALPSVANTGWEAPIVMTLNGTKPAGISMPGGDFYWSDQDPKKGHNPAYTKIPSGTPTVATSLFMKSDTTANGGGNLQANPPGGAITDGEWSCHSCHGMHARFSDSYTAYRQLKRTVNGKKVTGDVRGYGVESTAGNVVQDPSFEPIKSNSRGDLRGGTNDTNYVNSRPDDPTGALDGASLFAQYGDTNKNIYRGGFSSFCSACHGDFHGGATSAGGEANGGAASTKAGQGANVRDQTAAAWLRHPTNLKMSESAKYGLGSATTGYLVQVINAQNTNPNPAGYDWKYPLVVADQSFVVKSNVASPTTGDLGLTDSRLSCLTCHQAHATQFENMVRWDANGHAFIAAGQIDPQTGVAVTDDNVAYGCGKCHQKGGRKAFINQFAPGQP